MVCALAFAPSAFARENVTEWYVKDFRSEITVNKDSSLDVTEYITADCGIAQKHGIYRVLPLKKQLTETESIVMPVKLISITDFDGKPIKYQTSRDYKDQTVTWKIGDADVFVSGVNYYKIKYKIKNAIWANSSDFDEFYWNLSGNFWDIPIDHFEAEIKFPDGINEQNSKVVLYSGGFSESGNYLNATSNFTDGNVLRVEVRETMNPGDGVTVSSSFPKGLVTAHKAGFWEKYWRNLYYLIPLLVLLICYRLWSRNGRDPRINPTVAPEFDAPEKLCPMDLGMVYTDGSLNRDFISASIVNLAVKGYLTIKKIGKKGVFSKDDFELSKKKSFDNLPESEKVLANKLFGSKDKILISSLKNKFYQDIPKISDASMKYLSGQGWLKKSSRTWSGCFWGAGIVLLISAGVWSPFGTQLLIAVIASGVIVLLFAPLMKSRTKKGAELLRQVKGFKLYMDTAEKYRQKFNEKENIFERFLPYAIVFGIAKEWAKKMREIYGEEYFSHYHPIWLIGTDYGSFNADSFSSEISSISSNMASTISSSPSSSGSGGGGFSGGGGGGGGGGGW